MATIENELTREQVVALLQCLAGSHPKKKLKPDIIVGRAGDPECKNIAIQAEGYSFSFAHIASKEGPPFMELRVVTTPKGAQYRALAENLFKRIPEADRRAILAMAGERKKQSGITVEAIYVVMKDGCAVGPMYDKGLGATGKGFPQGMLPNRFYGKPDAEEMAEKFRAYLDDLEAKPNKKKKK